MNALGPRSLKRIFCPCGSKTNSERVKPTTDVLRLCHRGNECPCNSKTPDLTPTQQGNFSSVLLFMVLPRQDVSCVLYKITHIYELFWRSFKSWIWQGFLCCKIDLTFQNAAVILLRLLHPSLQICLLPRDSMCELMLVKNIIIHLNSINLYSLELKYNRRFEVSTEVWMRSQVLRCDATSLGEKKSR
jgi:hypothetical protein